MTDITELVPFLRAAAEAATPGKWRAFQFDNGRCGVAGGLENEIMVCEHISKERPHDAMFIAMANPANILVLVEALEKAQRRIEELEREKSYATFQPIAARDVLKERLRQVEKKDWTPAHDDEHTKCELSRAAISYLLVLINPQASHKWWPWDFKSWKPTPNNARRNLVKAAALILAEIDRLDRLSNDEEKP